MTAVAAAPYYRTFELPWLSPPEDRERFRRILLACLAAVLVLSLIVPFLPTPKVDLNVPPPVPPRLAKLVLERTTPLPPPPPPPPVEERLPDKAPQEEPPTQARKAAEEAKRGPDLDHTQQARKKASQAGLLPFVDQLADLRQQFEVTPDKVKPTANTAGSASGTPRAERSLITSKAGTMSGGINTAAVSKGFGYGTGSVGGHSTTQMQVPFGGSGNGSALQGSGQGDGATRTGTGKKPSRSREEIELVFDRNKAAIYALYNRALRDNPALLGKVVVQLTIAPSGAVTDCRIVSSELHDPELERKLVARIRMFRFAEKDVETITTTKPIEFFPA